MAFPILVLLILGLSGPSLVLAVESSPDAGASQAPRLAPPTGSSSGWHYGAYLDVSYPLDFNFPENHRFRTRTTTSRVNELTPNMAVVYIKKDATEQSRWGMEFGVQSGYDSTDFAFGQDQPHVGSADTLRHFSRANVSYLLSPSANGPTVTVGLFNSLIGYESLYTKDNPNYTRSWIADNSPYMMFGVNARYPVQQDLTLTLAVINGYWHLAHPNNQPSYAAQARWTPTSRLTITQNFYYGPDQMNTDLKFWRFFSDSIVQWKSERVTIALAYDIGTERMAERPDGLRTFWTGSALFTRWQVCDRWAVAARPEFYWDRNGRQTGVEQVVKAITSTVEYAVPYSRTNTRFRLEHRYDDSTGAQGGFFRGGDVRPGVPGLAQGQHLLIFAILWTYNSP
jgi:hypothetical protein